MKRSFVLKIVLALLLAACAAPAPEVIEKEVIVEKEVLATVEVEKEVVVEKTVVETAVVEKRPPPELCDPDNPSPRSFRPATDFERERVPNPYLDGRPAVAVSSCCSSGLQERKRADLQDDC